MKAVIIEDELRNTLVLANFVNHYCKDVRILGEAESIQEGIALINNTEPDLVFLDIELKDGIGLSILDHFPSKTFTTIVVTGYNQYALQAIKKNALDYLLKPIVIKDLVAAVEKAKTRLEEINVLEQLKQVKKIEKIEDQKILISNQKGKVRVVSPSDLLYVEAKNQYTKWVSKSASTNTVRYSLQKSIELLPNYFFQVHRSFLVNLNFVTAYDKGRGGFLKLGSIEIPVSNRRKKELILRLVQKPNSDKK